jgi:FdhD protein
MMRQPLLNPYSGYGVFLKNLSMPQSAGIKSTTIFQFHNGQRKERTDTVACEEPLEIKLAFGKEGQREQRSLAITMRTPGQDEALAIGFLFTEGIIGQASEVIGVRHVGQALSPESEKNILLVELSPDTLVDFEQLSRHFYTSSSCGVCGKASIEMLRAVNLYYPRHGFPTYSPKQIQQFPWQMMDHQPIFEQTGGIHAAAAFDEQGQLLCLQEDVGRHNAMDKLIGQTMRTGDFPMRNQAVMVSGRLSFELVQKAAMVGVPLLAAVGAPSSLAVELAESHGMTLIGFLRGRRFNVYAGVERVVV